jgi:hypothetical protein
MTGEFKDLRITEPNLHDGQLRSLSIRDKDLRIGCVDAAGRAYTLWLLDVRHLKADNFRFGNIIFGVEVCAGRDCSEDWVRQSAGLDIAERGDWVQKEAASIGEGGWSGVRISSSYGCEVVAVCKSWRFEQMEPE